MEEVRREDDTEESETEELKRPRGHLPRIPSKCQGSPVLEAGKGGYGCWGETLEDSWRWWERPWKDSMLP